MTHRDPLHDQIIGQLYEGILSEDGWRQALLGIAEATGSGVVNTAVINPQTQTALLVEFVGQSPDALVAYNNYYHKIDEALPIAPGIAPGQWYHDERHIGRERMRQSEYYQDFLLRHGVSTSICNHLLKDDGGMDTYLTLSRRPGQPGYTDAELRTYGQTFIPHVQRAMRLRIELDRLSGGANLAALALDRLRIPTLVLDEDARILHSNAQAQALMRRTPQLAVQHGRLEPQGMAAGQFEHLLQSACGRHGPAVAGGVRFKKYAHGICGGGEAYVISAMPGLAFTRPRLKAQPLVAPARPRAAARTRPGASAACAAGVAAPTV
jgi:PAS domain-containing protein